MTKLPLYMLALCLLTSCATPIVLTTGPGAYRVTFPDGSGLKASAFACARTSPTELECIDVEAFLRAVEEARHAAQRPLSQEI